MSDRKPLYTVPTPGKFRARTATFDLAGLDADQRIVPMSISSDTDQILRWVPGIGNDGYGAMAWEVLDHSNPANINLSRFAEPNGGPLLLEHSREASHGPAVVGRYHVTAIADGKIQGFGQLGTHDRADQTWQAVQDKSLTDTSCYYDYDPKDVEVTGFRDGFPVATVHKWALTEASLVAVPADITTGVGRAFGSPGTLTEANAAALAGSDTPNQDAFNTQEPVAAGGVVNPGGEDPSQDPDPEGESIRAEDDDLYHKDPDCDDEDCWERQNDDGAWEQHLCERCACGRDFKCDDPDCFADHLCSRCACGRSNDPEYNEKKYGDVEFADEKNKKYPLDQKHLKAAWSYINKKKDAAKYSKAELKTVRDRIIAAYKKAYGEEPPSLQNEDDRAAQPPAGARATPAAVAGTGQRSATTTPAAPGRPITEGGSPMEPTTTPAGQAAAANVADALQIRSIAAQLGHAAKAEELLAAHPVDVARTLILKHIQENPVHRTQSLEELGASEGEIKSFNIGRALLSQLDKMTGTNSPCFEREVSETLRKQMPGNYQQHDGLFLPYALRKPGQRGQRDTPLTTFTANLGAEAVFTEPGQTIDVLRNLLVTAKLGATVYTGLDAPLGLPRQDTDITASWVAESTGTATESEFATSLVTLTPHTLMGTTAVTRQLLEIAVKSFETQSRVINSIAYASQKAIDAAGLVGTGVTPIPQGIWTAASVNAVDFNHIAPGTGVVPAATFAFQDILKMIAAVVGSNVPLTKPAFVANVQLAAILAGTLKFNVAGALPVWDGSLLEGVVAGFPALSSNQMPQTMTPTGMGGNQQAFIFGSFDEMLIGLFGNGFEIIVDPFTQKKSGIIEITSFNMADVKLAHPQAFCIGTDIWLGGAAQTVS